MLEPCVDIECCRFCSSSDLKLVLDLGNQPLANSLQTYPGEHEARFPLRVVRCGECSLVQLDVNIDPDVLFSQYVWTTGTSPSTALYCRSLAGRVVALLNRSQIRVLEMASNDGTLLREFQQLGASVLGVDPAANIAKMANERGIPTLPTFLDLATAVDIVDEYGVFDVSIARNVMSHVGNPRDSAEALAYVLAPGGYAFVEFHSARTILSELHYDSVYHEHTMYHSLHSMSSLLRSVGLQVVDVWPSPISGGSWTLVAMKGSQVLHHGAVLEQELTREKHLGVLNQSRWERFEEDVSWHRRCLLAALNEYSDLEVSGYGASARSSTAINFWDLGPEVISRLADSNPLKQGRYSPGSSIPIVAPDEILRVNPDGVLVFAFNFLDEIRDFLVRGGWQGDLIVPFPNRVTVESIK